ncbi:transporter Avl9 (macronuclear) [Tetrahymena thermophila SB210]|uniref:Transporter Avl9 n=1 Tax=Tetrahymena thermophila (strain SB210) TaxID=312017 RepID=I7LU39_TETTS|nr:transporter Avl9 [Tetrahymena thermophila SB210]EAR89363.1 transporter Avl9 [Tetrahymena thermophila SB210]|eukprot:XP_001009608.1 transporter Avl9 [Tetrahymena thermophila SB210]
MKKWIEKGKQFLKKLEEDHDKKKKEAKQNQDKQQSEEEKKESMMSKSLDDDKMYKLGQLLLNPTPLEDNNKFKLQNSAFFRQQINYISLCEQLRKNNHEIDFQSQGFQQLLKQIYNQDQEYQAPIIEQNPLFLIGVVGFHHKKGSVVEFFHPSNMNDLNQEQQQYILDSLPNYCMPDAIHNKNEDYVYFTLTIKLNSNEYTLNNQNEQSQNLVQTTKQVTLFGVSYFKQIKVNEKMRQMDKELTRSHLQKSLFVLSTVPLQGYIMGRLEPTTKAYFDQENITDYEILKCAYDNMNLTLKNNQNIQESEIYIGTSLKTMIHFFKEKTLVILKALLLQKKILVYSLHSCSTSNFVMSLISLIPGLSFFKFKSKYIDIIQSALGEYGLPLRVFNEQDCPLELYFTIQQLDNMDKYKGYLIGTTNQLIRSHKKTGADLIVDLDTNQLIIQNEAIKTSLQLNSEEKKFMEGITKTVNKVVSESDKNWKNMEYSQNDSSFIGSNDWIRQQFTKYIIDLLCEIELVKKRYRDFQDEISNRLKRKSSLGKKDDARINQKLDKLENNLSHRKEKDEFQIESGNQDHQIQQSQSTTASTISDLDSKQEITQKRKVSNLSEKSQNSNDEEIINELFDDFLNFDSDEEEQQASYGQQSNKYAKFNQLDGDTLLAFNIDSEVSKTEKIFKQKKKQLKISYATLKKYNFKFLKEFFLTENYKYWLLHHDDQIYLRSINCSELTQRSCITLESGQIFFGSMQNGERNGKGTTFDQIQGKIEQCENYENDMKNGKTTIVTLKNDYYFEGDFIDDQKQGFGNLVTDKLKYCGSFNLDKFNGQGTLVDKDQSLYEGEFQNNMKNGMGKYRSGDSSINYVGQFIDDLFSDKGQLVKSNGDVYCGDFKKGQMHGQGEYQSEGYSYTGEFLHNKFNGQGFYKDLKTNNIYQGEFVENQLDPEQQHIIKYHNGDVYSGFIKDWQPNGEGLICYKDGKIVKGIFESGIIKQQFE